MRGEILSISVVSRPSGDPYLTISRVSIIFPKLAKLVPSPRPRRSGLVVGPPAPNPRGRVRIHLLPQPRCDFVAARDFSASKKGLSYNYIV